MKSKGQEEAGHGSAEGATAYPNMSAHHVEENINPKSGALGVSTATLRTSSALRPNPSFTF